MGAILWATLRVTSLAAANPPNAEAARFNDITFRTELRDRGLTELLELYLTEHPLSDPAEGSLQLRQLKLAQYADATRPVEERMEALRQADQLLAQLFRSRPDDRRALEWRLEWVQSLLYRHAEPHYTSILFRGGSEEDRERLFVSMSQAAEELNRLAELLEKEYARLDELPAGQFDRLERDGYVQTLERLRPRVEYTRWWVTLYRAISRRPGDPLRDQELHSVLKSLEAPSEALVVPHETSHVQAQALLLAGMASRLLGDDTAALSYLSSAIDTVRGLSNRKEREDLNWVVTLALLERVKAFRDSGPFERACQAVEEFRRHLSAVAPTDFGLQLSLGLIEESVYAGEAARAEARGMIEVARSLRERSSRSLSELAARNPRARDDVYATLYERIGPDTDGSRLSGLEQCALLAGLLRDARQAQAELSAIERGEGGASRREELEARRRERLDRAIAYAPSLLAESPPLPDPLRSEVLFNLAVAHYDRGHPQEAASRFLEVAQTFPSFERTPAAARNAVQLASQLYADRSLRSQPPIRQLYIQCLQAVTGAAGDPETARYWMYFLGQTYEETGDLNAAALAYERVDPSHEFHLAALCGAVRCRANALKETVSTAAPDATAARRDYAVVKAAAERFMAAAGECGGSATDAATLSALCARVALNRAEVAVLPGVDQPEDALADLRDFETRFPGQTDLIGRVLWVRLLAYEALGRLDEAEVAVPRYIQSDPANSGATLQGLFDSIRAEVERLQQAGRQAEADRKAASALLLARQIREWALHRSPPLSPADLYAVTRQLAESHLRAGQWEAARQTFEECLQIDASRYEDRRPRDLRALTGQAEALYAMKRFDAALPLFNRVVRESGVRDGAWWQALLRDLQCRTELKQDSQGVLKVIAQHRFLDPNMGGLRERFDELETANRNRARPG